MYIYIYIYTYTYTGFYLLGDGRSPPNSQKFAYSPPPKVTPSLTKQEFSSYNVIKTAFLAVFNTPVPFLF